MTLYMSCSARSYMCTVLAGNIVIAAKLHVILNGGKCTCSTWVAGLLQIYPSWPTEADHRPPREWHHDQVCVSMMRNTMVETTWLSILLICTCRSIHDVKATDMGRYCNHQYYYSRHVVPRAYWAALPPPIPLCCRCGHCQVQGRGELWRERGGEGTRWQAQHGQFTCGKIAHQRRWSGAHEHWCEWVIDIHVHVLYSQSWVLTPKAVDWYGYNIIMQIILWSAWIWQLLRETAKSYFPANFFGYTVHTCTLSFLYP
jgi:hypothetical protein